MQVRQIFRIGCRCFELGFEKVLTMSRGSHTGRFLEDRQACPAKFGTNASEAGSLVESKWAQASSNTTKFRDRRF